MRHVKRISKRLSGKTKKGVAFRAKDVVEKKKRAEVRKKLKSFEDPISS